MHLLLNHLQFVLSAILVFHFLASSPISAGSKHDGIKMADQAPAIKFRNQLRLDGRSIDRTASIDDHMHRDQSNQAFSSLDRRLEDQTILLPRWDKKGRAKGNGRGQSRGQSQEESEGKEQGGQGKGNANYEKATQQFAASMQTMKNLHRALETARVNEHGITVEDNTTNHQFQHWVDQILQSQNQASLQADYQQFIETRNMMQRSAQIHRLEGNVRAAVAVEKTCRNLMKEVDSVQALGKSLIRQWKAARAKTTAGSGDTKAEGKSGSSKGKKGSGLRKGFLRR